MSWITRARATWRRRSSPPDVDIDAVLASGRPDPDVLELLDRVAGRIDAEGSARAGSLLEADTVALVVWTREHHVYCYDAVGRCVGIAAHEGPGSRRWHRDVGLEFVDAAGPSFAVWTWSSDVTTLLGGRTSATVAIDDDVLGTVDQRDEGSRRDGHGRLLVRCDRWTHRRTASGRTADHVSILRFTPDAGSDVRALALAREICHEVQRRKHALWIG